MANIYNTEAKNLTFGDLTDAVETLEKISKDPSVAKMFLKIAEKTFEPKLKKLLKETGTTI